MAIPEGGKGPWGAPTLLDVPLDENSSYKRGSAAAPPLIRDALTSESSNMWTELGVDVGAEGAYADGGEVEFGNRDRFAGDRNQRPLGFFLHAAGPLPGIGADLDAERPRMAGHGGRSDF